jgi:hypothetical protein
MKFSKILLLCTVLCYSVTLYSQKRFVSKPFEIACNPGIGINTGTNLVPKPAFAPNISLQKSFGKLGIGMELGYQLVKTEVDFANYYNRLLPYTNQSTGLPKNPNLAYGLIGPTFNLYNKKLDANISFLAGIINTRFSNFSMGHSDGPALPSFSFVNSSINASVNSLGIKPGINATYWIRKGIGIRFNAAYLINTNSSTNEISYKDFSTTAIIPGVPASIIRQNINAAPTRTQKISAPTAALNVGVGINFKFTNDKKRVVNKHNNNKSICLCGGMSVTSPTLGNITNNSTFNLNCNTTFQLQANVTCAAQCVGAIQYYTTNNGVATPTTLLANNALVNYTPNSNGTHQIFLRGNCGIDSCNWFVINLNVTNCGQSTCICPEPPNTILLNNVSVPLNGPAPVSLPCNSIVPFNAILNNCAGATNCGVQQATNWQLTNAAGILIQSGNGTQGNLSPVSQSGIYTLQFSGYCGTALCSFKIQINFTCNNSSCACNIPPTMMFNSQTIVTNNTTPIPVGCNSQIPFNIVMGCIGTATNCPQVPQNVTWKVTNSLNTIIQNGAGNTGNINPITTAGNYVLEITGNCGGQICTVKIRFTIGNCSCGNFEIFKANINHTQETCLKPGDYKLIINPSIPNNAIVNITITTQGNTFGPLSIPYTGGLNVSVPNYNCTKVNTITWKLQWTHNGVTCEQTITKDICKPSCCEYIKSIGVPQLSWNILGTRLQFSQPFNFDFSAYGGSLTFDKVKIQILKIVRGGSTYASSANLKNVSVFGNAPNVNGIPAIVATGNAIWPPSSITLSSGSTTISGDIINVGPLTNSYQVVLRYTFYTNTSGINKCLEMHCTQDITYNLNNIINN